jgi:diguanylate cyclase (GGDEF)-like protein/PAS domain S-box-containing protein
MQSAPLRPDETASLQALDSLEVLDSGAEGEFDALVDVASHVCGAPISLITLIDANRQWFKANVGLPGVAETAREVAFCAHTVLGTDLFEVPDASMDERFHDNPLVTGPPDIRFYAGAPIVLSSGHRVGTLCVIDNEPRRLNDHQRRVLMQLSVVAARAMEGRLALRKASETSFRNAQASAVLEHSSDAVVGLDAEGTINRWNPAAERLFGYSTFEAIGLPVSMLVPAEQQAQELNAFDRLRDGAQSYESIRRRADGSTVQVAVTLVAEFDENEVLLGATKFVRDVTAQHDASAALAKSAADLQLVVNAVPSMMAYWNADLRCRFANTAYKDWFGKAPGTLVGTHLRDLLGPGLFEQNRVYIEGALAGISQTFERTIPCPDGVTRYSLAHYIPDVKDGVVKGFLVQVNDVTPLKDTEQALRIEIELRESQHRELQSLARSLEQAQQLGRIGSWEWRADTDTTTWSAEMYRLYGIDPASRAPTFAERESHVTPDSWQILRSAVERAQQYGDAFAIELQLPRPDGTFEWLDARGEPVWDEQGKVVLLRGTAQDITDRKRLLAEVSEQHELLRVTLRSIADAVITTDAQSEVTSLNAVAERMTGWLSKDAVGMRLEQVFHILQEETRNLAPWPISTGTVENAVVGLQSRTLLISRDGREFGIEDSASPIRDDNGDLRGSVLVFRDVTEQRRMSGEMTFRATHDALTGLVNRSEFDSRLQRALDWAHADNVEHALMYIDLDQFKLVNDACGHAAGDLLLKQVAQLLQDTVRARDTLARLGGDEFAVILEHCHTEQARRVAEQICDRLNDYRFVHDERRFRIGASIGLIPLDRRWKSPAAAIQAADTSCYAAKEEGRNRVHVWFETDLVMKARQGETQWAARIEQALDEDRFLLFAQRIHPIGAPTAQIHAEVLLRLRDEQGNVILPGAFLPAAERFHLATRIDRWVLLHVVARLTSMPTLENVGLLSINLSGQSVGDRAFHRQAGDLLTTAGPQVCRSLCIEITETAAITNMADAKSFITQLRQLGVRIALDDFGAGASSFGYLKALHVDILKIDGQFIGDLIADALNDAAVRCFVDVAKVLGLKTVAEFVETQSVLTRLEEIGVDYAQGFLLDRPCLLEDVLQNSSAL